MTFIAWAKSANSSSVSITIASDEKSPFEMATRRSFISRIGRVIEFVVFLAMMADNKMAITPKTTVTIIEIVCLSANRSPSAIISSSIP